MRDPYSGKILSRKAVAQTAGTTERSLDNYEKRASRCASRAVRAAIAAALGTTVDRLFDAKGNAK